MDKITEISAAFGFFKFYFKGYLFLAAFAIRHLDHSVFVFTQDNTELCSVNHTPATSLAFFHISTKHFNVSYNDLMW